MDELCEYVREEVSIEGVEVGSRGVRSVTLKLPPELPRLTELIAELYDRYGASCALKQTNEPAGASITVWLDAAPSHDGGGGTRAGVAAAAGAVGFVACALAFHFSQLTTDWSAYMA